MISALPIRFVCEDMPQPNSYPPLKSLHPNTSFSPAKLSELERLSTEALVQSLAPGKRDCLKTRPDGTMVEGHHRVHILRQRGVDVEALPCEIVNKQEIDFPGKA